MPEATIIVKVINEAAEVTQGNFVFYSQVTGVSSVVAEGNPLAAAARTVESEFTYYTYHSVQGPQSPIISPNYLTAEEYPVLARIWANDDDEVFDTL